MSPTVILAVQSVDSGGRGVMWVTLFPGEIKLSNRGCTVATNYTDEIGGLSGVENVFGVWSERSLLTVRLSSDLF